MATSETIMPARARFKAKSKQSMDLPTTLMKSMPKDANNGPEEKKAADDGQKDHDQEKQQHDKAADDQKDCGQEKKQDNQAADNVQEKEQHHQATDDGQEKPQHDKAADDGEMPTDEGIKDEALFLLKHKTILCHIVFHSIP